MSLCYYWFALPFCPWTLILKLVKPKSRDYTRRFRQTIKHL